MTLLGSVEVGAWPIEVQGGTLSLDILLGLPLDCVCTEGPALDLARALVPLLRRIERARQWEGGSALYKLPSSP
jgi:hypothetical protein